MENLIIFLILLALGYGVGTYREKRHYRSIVEREKALLHLPAVTMKTLPMAPETVTQSRLVAGSVVVAADYFKQILARLRNIFGGNVVVYESLIDRARREAVLRMKEEAGDASIIVNVRIETSTIGKGNKNKGMPSIEALAFGTALTVEKG